MNSNPIPPPKEIKKALLYDMGAGQLVWAIERSNGGKIFGKIAGNLNKEGYRTLGFLKRRYQVHRLIWYFHYGDWPALDIDHINGNRADNRITNLRLATHRQNLHNTKHHRSGKLVGCHFLKSLGRWRAMITIDHKRVFLGMHKTEELAHSAYKEALKNLADGSKW